MISILYGYLAFTLGIWIRRAFLLTGAIKKFTCIPNKPWDPDIRGNLVSVIVPCRNEAHNLPHLLPSLLRQDYKNIEFVFLDDRSTDNTLSILYKYQKKRCKNQDY